MDRRRFLKSLGVIAGAMVAAPLAAAAPVVNRERDISAGFDRGTKSWSYITVYRIADNKIVESRTYRHGA